MARRRMVMFDDVHNAINFITDLTQQIPYASPNVMDTHVEYYVDREDELKAMRIEWRYGAKEARPL